MAKLSENAVKILSFLQENDGNYTATDIAESLGLPVKTVNGVITGGLIGRNHSRDFVERVESKATDAEGKEVCDMKLHPEVANVIEFGLKAGDADKVFTFQKYSGTGNIFISSIEITPVASVVLGDVNGDNNITMADANAVVNYFLASDADKVQMVENNFNVVAADVNGDGDITMADANAIVNIFLGVGNE